MGTCLSVSPRRASSIASCPQDDSFLAIVRGTAPGALSGARVMHHVTLWDEYSTAEPPEVLGTGFNGPVLKVHSKRRPELAYALKEIRKIPAPGGDVYSLPTHFEVKRIQRLHSSMLLNELLIYLAVDHANIGKIFEVYESPTSVFLVTELCAGGELYALLRRCGKLNEIEAAYVVSQILRAINYLHNLGIAHGDIKLENFVFLKPITNSVFNNPLKLIDFGFSRQSGEKPGGVYGSPLYISPETAVGKSSISSDVWSVGVITYMLLTDSAPFTGKSFKQVAADIESKNVEDLIDKILKLSQDGKAFMRSCLRKDPTQRLSAKEALGHNWISSIAARHTRTKDEDVIKCLELIIEFSRIGPLRRASLGLVSMHGPPSIAIPSSESIFNLIDSNSDGYIQSWELLAALTKYKEQAETDIEGLFAGIDVRGDGRINFSEFLAATEVLAVVSSQTIPLPPIYEALIESVFKKLDVDNSGVISEMNLLTLFGLRGYQGAGAADLIKEGDFAGDGVISLSEFFRLVTGNTS